MSSQENNYAYQSYIKDVYIELPGYEFHHSPLGKESDDSKEKKSEKSSNDERFLGRETITNSFLNILLNTAEHNNSGSYLVTGYRGMGKTSFVKRVVNKYKQELENRNPQSIVEKIDISFAQSDLSEADILKQITNNLISITEKNPLLKIGKLLSLGNIFRLVGFALMFAVFFYFIFMYDYDLLSEINSEKSLDSTITKITLPFSRSDSTTKNDTSESRIIYNYKIKDSTHTKPDTLKKGFAIIEHQPNPIMQILDTQNKDKISTLLAYLILMTFFGLTITYTFTTLKDVFLFFIQNFKPTPKKIIYLIFLSGIIFFYFIDELISWYYLTILTSLNIVILTVCFFNIRYLKEKVIDEFSIHKRLKLLQERSNAAITSEQGLQSVSEQLPIGFIQRKVKQYAIKNPKEIEYELIEILQDYSKFKKYKKKFVIVFDELDKVEPAFGRGFYHDDFEVSEQTEFSQNKLNEIRKRKNLIINILSTLKYFITVADAKFIFIAGREMFDAALADIADRESFISSIFHHVFYVDSFLKDSKENAFRSQGVTGLVEQYLQEIMFRTPPKNESLFLKNYFEYLNTIKVKKNEKEEDKYSNEEKLKVIFTLQNFIVYLAYRSNGSPKKLTKLVEEHIVSFKKIEKNDLKLFITHDSNGKNNPSDDYNRLFLAFPFRQQYRFGFISYLYHPFIIAQGEIIKKFSDTILVSTPYLMDHIIKFHPFAFSIENLELLPEIINNNRNPMFRYFIEELIKYLRSSHIRETELGLFDYKFFSKTSNEINYISKLYEDELAAFNFSLDEMSNVKLYVQNKIRLIRDSYNKLNTGENEQGKSVIYSIAFLNNLLGDTQYFDQEYDNSIVAYLDGLQLLRESKEESFERIVLSVKLKLKLGLIYEKMKNNAMALSYFNDAVADIRRYMYREVKRELPLNEIQDERLKIEYLNEIESATSKGVISYSEVLQIANLPYAASLYLQEKHNVEGINIKRIENYSNDFQNIIAIINKKDGNSSIVLADHYNDIGNLLYYKNHVFKKENTKIGGKSAFNYLVEELIQDERTIKLIDNKNYNKDFRAPYKAFIYYKKAIRELLGTERELENKKRNLIENIENKKREIQKKEIEKQQETKSQKKLKVYIRIKEINKEIKHISTQIDEIESRSVNINYLLFCQNTAEKIHFFENIYSKMYLKTLAFSFSNAGNCLFSVAQLEEKDSKPLQDFLTIWDNRDAISQFFRQCLQGKIILKYIKKELSLSTLYSNEKVKKFINEELGYIKMCQNKLQYERAEYSIRQLSNINRPMVFWDIMTHHYFRKLNYMFLKKEKTNNTNLVKINHTEFVIFNYYLAGRLYSKIGKNVTFSFQLRKILQVVRNGIIFDSDDVNAQNSNSGRVHNDKLIDFLEKSLLPMILEATSWNSSSTDRPQIYKYKYIEGLKDIYHPEAYTKYNYSNISNNPETKEVIFFMADIKIRNLDINKLDTNKYSKLQKDIEHLYQQFQINIKKINARMNDIQAELNIFCQQKKSLEQIEEFNKEIELKISKVNEVISEAQKNFDSDLSDLLEKINKYKNESKIPFYKENIPEMHLVNPYNGISSQFSRIQELDLQEKINQLLLVKIFPAYKIWEGDSPKSSLFNFHKRNPIFFKKENKNSSSAGNSQQFKNNNLQLLSNDIYEIGKIIENISKQKKITGKITLSTIRNEICEIQAKCKNLLKNIDKKVIDNLIKFFKIFNEEQFEDYKKITANSIFSIIQIINIIKIYGVNQYLTYSYLAHFQRKLGRWLKHYELCDLYDHYENIVKEDTIKFYLENMLGTEAMVTLDTTSQFQNALQNYHKAKQMHSNGITYHQDMSNFIYLEGDFDDNLNHFGIALERQKINSQQVRERIKELERELESSPLYKYSSYANIEDVNLGESI